MGKRKARTELTAQERTFVSEYMIDYNTTRAYMCAFPDTLHTSARASGSRFRRTPLVAAEIEYRMEARFAVNELSADKVLEEAKLLAFTDPLHLFQDDGCTPRTMRQIPPEVRRMIQTVKVSRERTTTTTTTRGETTTTVSTNHSILEFKLHSKKDGLDRLWQYMGLNKEIPPLEVLLGLLPTELSGPIRAALARALSGA